MVNILRINVYYASFLAQEFVILSSLLCFIRIICQYPAILESIKWTERSYQFSICLPCPFLELWVVYYVSMKFFKLSLSLAWSFILNMYNHLYENMCSRREFINSIETRIYAFIHEHMKISNIIHNTRIYTLYKYDIWSNVYSSRQQKCFFLSFSILLPSTHEDRGQFLQIPLLLDWFNWI